LTVPAVLAGATGYSASPDETDEYGLPLCAMNTAAVGKGLPNQSGCGRETAGRKEGEHPDAAARVILRAAKRPEPL